jgi:hypothetical protein
MRWQRRSGKWKPINRSRSAILRSQGQIYTCTSQKGRHVISWKLYSCLFFVDVRCFITNIDKILMVEKEYLRCQNIED